MKRCLVMSLCAVALMALGINAARADVDVALNLRYTDPADPNDGGTWTLVAKSDTTSSQGIVGLAVRFDGGTMPASGTVDSNIGHDIYDPNNPLGIASFDHDGDPNTPAQTEFTYGQDPNGSIPGFVTDVGLSGSPALWNGGVDPLDGQDIQGAGTGNWDFATVIATGSIADLSTRPGIFSVLANEYDPTLTLDPNSPVAEATIGTFTVRGDSLVTLGLEDPNDSGLLAGDADRDGDVDIADLGNLAGSLTSGVGGWDDGDTDGDGDVDIADLGALAGNLGDLGVPPAIHAVPEPACFALAFLGLTAFGLQRHRKRGTAVF